MLVKCPACEPSDADAPLELRYCAPRRNVFTPDEHAYQFLKALDDAPKDALIAPGQIVLHRRLLRKLYVPDGLADNAARSEGRKARHALEKRIRETNAIDVTNALKRFNGFQEQIETAPDGIGERLQNIMNQKGLSIEQKRGMIAELLLEHEALLKQLTNKEGASYANASSGCCHLNNQTTVFLEYCLRRLPERPAGERMTLEAFLKQFDRALNDWPHRELKLETCGPIIDELCYKVKDFVFRTLDPDECVSVPGNFIMPLREDDDGSHDGWVLTPVAWTYFASALMDMIGDLEGYIKLPPTEPPPELPKDAQTAADIGDWLVSVYEIVEDENSRGSEFEQGRRDAYNSEIRPGCADTTLFTAIADCATGSTTTNTLFGYVWPLRVEVAQKVMLQWDANFASEMNVSVLLGRTLNCAFARNGFSNQYVTRVEMRNPDFKCPKDAVVQLCRTSYCVVWTDGGGHTHRYGPFASAVAAYALWLHLHGKCLKKTTTAPAFTLQKDVRSLYALAEELVEEALDEEIERQKDVEAKEEELFPGGQIPTFTQADIDRLDID